MREYPVPDSISKDRIAIARDVRVRLFKDSLRTLRYSLSLWHTYQRIYESIEAGDPTKLYILSAMSILRCL